MRAGSDVGRAPGRDRKTIPPRRILEFVPWHDAVRGAFDLGVSLDGQRIAELEVRPAPLHRGFEKQCEGCSWSEALLWVERLGEVSGVAASTAYCLCVERLLALDVPERALWLRMLASELARVLDHMTRLARMAAQLRANAAGAWMLEARERVFSLMESLSGARVHGRFVCIGGVRRPLPEGFADALRDTRAWLRPQLRDFDRVLSGTRIFDHRMRGIGRLGREDCLRFSLSGPLARAAGVDADLRRDDPYFAYEHVSFALPLGRDGDNYARYLVCLEEIEQSLRIIEQAVEQLAGLGGGPIRVAAEQLAGLEPEASVVVGGGAEELKSSQAVAGGPASGAAIAVGEAYGAVESANGELGFFVVSDGSIRPLRVHCRAPSLFTLQALAVAARGDPVADLGATLALMNVNGAECQR